MTTVTMITGEKITGKLVSQDSLNIYIAVENEIDELAIQVFGKDFCEANKITIEKLPKDEIKSID